jgi:hypothetical protein
MGAFYGVVPTVLLFVAFLVPLQLVLWLRSLQRRGRRSPLTTKLLRGPGTALREELEDASGDVSAYIGVLLFLPPLVLSVHLSQSYFGGQPETLFRIVLGSLLGVGGALFASFRLLRAAQRRFKLRCALDAEIAVAQELDQLMRQGAIAFHDFPAEEFNIDHVVVTRGGVFAVETKSRLKPDRGAGADEAKVVFDGHALVFPGWIDTATLEQARRQATWLGRWLSKAVGTGVDVKPVVALPGWYVERKAKSDVLVISGREAKSLMSGWRSEPLSDEMMNRIAHQLEERCRDVEPMQYGRAKKLGRMQPGRA